MEERDETQKVTDDAALAKESFWISIYHAAIQGLAGNIGMGISLEKVCEKAWATADRAVTDYGERWLGEEAPKPKRIVHRGGHHESVPREEAEV